MYNSHFQHCALAHLCVVNGVRVCHRSLGECPLSLRSLVDVNPLTNIMVYYCHLKTNKQQKTMVFLENFSTFTVCYETKMVENHKSIIIKRLRTTASLRDNVHSPGNF